MNAIVESLLTRRSIRAYQTRQVEDEKLEQVVKAGLNAPNGMNEQPWHFTVLQNKEKLEKLDTLVAGKGNSFFYHAPTLILMSIETGSKFAQADTGCALASMMQAAHALGLGSVWCNRINGNPALDTKLGEFGVPDGYRVTGTLALGYADEEPEPKQMKEGTVNYVR